ncbi:MAG: hypothetical protein IPL72_07695 [Sulfuritalea sp.]|nr:hypothetical protein [Sulfuritalea sp.]
MRRIEHIVDSRCMDTKPLPRHPITCETDGRTYKGTYWVAGKILTVSTALAARENRLAPRSPEALAKQLLLEPVKAGKT